MSESPASPPHSLRRSRLPRRWWLVALVAAVLLAAGGSLALLRGSSTVAAAPEAPDFSLPYAYGGHGSLALGALRGHPVLLTFTNSQCGPCLDDLSTVTWAARTYKAAGLRVVAVAAEGDTAGAASRLAAAAHLPFPLLFDSQASAWQYDVQTLPTTFFLDAAGRLHGQQVGPLTRQVVRDGLSQAGAIRCSACGVVEPLGALAAPVPAGKLAADFVFTPAKRASYFSLPDQNGRLVSPASLRGKVVALTFLSAVCREQCPLVGVTMRLVRSQMGASASRLSVVVVSVDPEQDSAANTALFALEAGWRGTDWHYLTAPRRVLAPIWAAYGIYVPPPSPIFRPGQTIVHEAGIYLLDASARLRAYFGVPVMAARIAAAARALL
jgi:cytochrome oxidase Cu insertion factor (SCO1/SenC/PrrC family)